MASSKVPISRLPLPPSSRILTHNLNPDPLAKSASDLFRLIKDQPSVLRKSRASHESAHFSYLTPLPLQFPYRISPPPSNITNEERLIYIEKVLATQEPTVEVSSVATDDASRDVQPSPQLHKYHSLEREHPSKELISLAPTCLRDCFPHLDVGDALLVTGQTKPGSTPTEEVKAAREELVSVLAGDVVLMDIPPTYSKEKGYAPWSLRYSGHQFGSWAGQLGDGRAISILETPHPERSDVVYEMQLKGAGRTPFSRGADGLAVLRSSVREYLAAEAMRALGIPTTRSLALLSLPNLPVAREEIETAAIVCRVAESFIRIGNFQALNSSEPNMTMLFGGGGGAFAQQAPDYEASRLLGEWVADKVLELPRAQGEPWAKKLVWECAKRNALMVAGWQAYGFMHGVMNTDNISIMGLTIDYGPYAFMDTFSQNHICNHSDETGRYSYKYQPTMIVYALKQLLQALGPIIGAELELGKAVGANWADGVPKGRLKTWEAEAEDLGDELEAFIMDIFVDEYKRLMRKRLALKSMKDDDFKSLFEPLMELMEKQRMDFSTTLRHLASFRPSWLSNQDQMIGETTDALDAFIRGLLLENSEDGDKAQLDVIGATQDWLSWLGRYANRINTEEERSAWATPDFEAAREAEGKLANPRFVLRQWVLEEVIKVLGDDAAAVVQGTRKVEDVSEGRRILNKVLLMCTSPFEDWGSEVRAGETVTAEEAREERRLCGTGPKKLLGFQCSCSS